jgi:hypothetical protein
MATLLRKWETTNPKKRLPEKGVLKEAKVAKAETAIAKETDNAKAKVLK